MPWSWLQMYIRGKQAQEWRLCFVSCAEAVLEVVLLEAMCPLLFEMRKLDKVQSRDDEVT